LFSVLSFQHIQNAYAGATLPNDASVRLHESLAFRPVGRFEQVGYKFGQWHDTIWWVKRIGAHAVPAPEILWLQDAEHMEGFQEALREGERLLRGPETSAR
jgi:phosphinothricin acetyltransferase